MLNLTARRLLRNFLVILLLVIGGFAISPGTTMAQAIVRGDRVFFGQVLDNDVIMFGNDVRLDGTVKGNAFITGRNITIDGNIEGSLFVIGQQVTINGNIDGGAYITAVSARLGSNGVVNQNLYFLGVSIATESTSRVGRDLNGLSLGAYLQGSVGRETRVIAGILQFLGMFMDIALGPAPAPLQLTNISNKPPGMGQVILPGDVVIDVIGQTTTPDDTEPEVVVQTGSPVGDWLLERLREFLPLFIVGLIGYWFFRKQLDTTATVIHSKPLTSLGIGLVGLVLMTAVIGAFILLFVLILMLGIWLGTISLWNVAWLFWSVAYPFSLLVFSLVFIFLNHGSKVVVAYAGVAALLGRFSPEHSRQYRPLLFILALIVFILLQAVPILGWVISVIVTAWGIGAAWLAWREHRSGTTADNAAVTSEKTGAPEGTIE